MQNVISLKLSAPGAEQAIASAQRAVDATKAIKRAEDRRQQQLTNYNTLRTLALRGELEAFVANAALDHETDVEKFDRIVEIEGAEWLKRGGAL